LTGCVLAEQEINAANVEKILSSVGVEADKEKLALVVKACKGKSTEELIATGLPKLAAMGGGGGGAAAAAPAAADAAAPAAAKKEEKKVESEEEEDDDMGFGLFD
jgi:large subunit ribosomal protein LP2